MKIVVMSDSHGDIMTVRKIISAHKDASIFIHLGDGEKDIETVRDENPLLTIYNVAGNCDIDRYSSSTPTSKVIKVRAVNMNIFICHGHNYSIKTTYEEIIEYSLKKECKIAMFGHTHKPYEGYKRNIFLFNPGSCSRYNESGISYGIIYIDNSGNISSEIRDI